MRHKEQPTVPQAVLRRHLVDALRRYWPANSHLLDCLPVAQRPFPQVTGPLKLVDVPVPQWAFQCAVDGCIAVPHEACSNPATPRWEEVDWWLAAFLMLECWHERSWELHHGVIHSYSFRLQGWDQRAWSRAWVNRIALFLREWASVELKQDSSVLFGPLPQAEIIMTHDVDAITKTLSIRLKQSSFLGFNALRLLARGKLTMAGRRIAQAFRFLLGRDDWDMVGVVQEIERQAGIRSQFNFYADDRPKSLKRWVFDPGYDLADPKILKLLKKLANEGWSIGLHQSHDAWRSNELMCSQKERLQSFLPVTVASCRQHWLRFSWNETWLAQSTAGFKQDTTLMFNDRPGFRAAAALSWAPWNPLSNSSHQLHELPTILMDSHFYDYQPMTADERLAAFSYWLDEIVSVRGQATVLWHPHTITKDYGWSTGFHQLLDCLRRTSAC